MLRIAMGLSVAAALLAATGCTMCCHPYDYCGPVYDSCGGHPCSLYYRAGSILAGTPELPEQVQHTIQDKSPLSVVAGGQMQAGDVPGSEQIVSVTDRVVEPAASLDGSTRVASEPLPAKGWTARRPTLEVR